VDWAGKMELGQAIRDLSKRRRALSGTTWGGGKVIDLEVSNKLDLCIM